jgi:hypothetical protein
VPLRVWSRGRVHHAAPLVDQLAGQAQCCGNNYTSIRDINISTASSDTERYTQTILRNDLTGEQGERSRQDSALSAQRGFLNWSGTNDGILGVFAYARPNG